MPGIITFLMSKPIMTLILRCLFISMEVIGFTHVNFPVLMHITILTMDTKLC